MTLNESDGRHTLHVVGELDIATKPLLSGALAVVCALPGEGVVVDASRLTFIDAAGLGALAAAHQRLAQQGRPGLVVEGAPPLVRRVFDITQLGSMLAEPTGARDRNPSPPPGEVLRGRSPEADEGTWQAEKRDFVADRRDDLADQRDRDADQREAEADEREGQAEAREEAMDERERQLDLRPRGPELDLRVDGEEHQARAAERTRSRDDRRAAQVERGRQDGSRQTAAAARQEAAERRLEATPNTALALAFAEMARFLCEADDFDEILSRIVHAAVASVSGAEMASITVRAGEDRFRTLASTDERAVAADGAQYDAGEGPSLDAVEEPIVYLPSLPDPRWPSLGSRPAEWGVFSVASWHLLAPPTTSDGPWAGSLNAYGGTAHAFDREAREIGLILAAHASVAVQGLRERDALGRLGHQLREALASRDVIGQAKGILMERLRMTPEDAFDALRRASQRFNLKLRELARQVAETGEWDLGQPAKHP